MRALTILLTALLLVAMLADDADAQRRRRRRRRPPPQETEQTTPEPVADDDPDAGAPTSDVPPNPLDEPPASPASAIQTAGEGAGATEPPPDGALVEPSNEPTAALDPGPTPPDVSPIRADYVTLMDELVQARMRVSALGSELFRTRVRVDLQDRTGERQALARIVVHLDGAPIFQSDGAVEGARDGRELFTGAVAPGPHVLTLEVEQRAREDDDFRYTLRESFRFEVTRERLSEVTLVLEDDSDMARSFPSGGEGRYEVRTRMRVATRALPSGS